MSESETPGQGRAGGSRTTTTKSDVSVTDDRDIVSQLRRRAARLGCPAGCAASYHEHPRLSEALPDTRRNLEAARQTWRHLADLGYIGRDDNDGGVTREWWLRALGVAS